MKTRIETLPSPTLAASRRAFMGCSSTLVPYLFVPERGLLTIQVDFSLNIF